jgi:Flp pilus assembly protein TadD
LPAIAELSSAQRVTNQADAPLSALLGHGHGLLDKGELESALDVYQRAVELDPTRPEARMFTGIAHYLSGDMERATHELRAALFLDSEAWLAAFYLASCHETLGHAEEARREYRHAAQVGQRMLRQATHPLAGWQTDLLDLARRRASR